MVCVFLGLGLVVGSLFISLCVPVFVWWWFDLVVILGVLVWRFWGFVFGIVLLRVLGSGANFVSWVGWCW